MDEKPHEHYLTHSHGGSASVLLWGPTVCPETGEIRECTRDELQQRWGLWERIHSWWSSVGEKDPAAQMRLSDADKHLLSSLHSLWFVMQCSPDDAQLKCAEKMAKKSLDIARSVPMTADSLRKQAADLRANALEAQKDGQVLVEIAESGKARAVDKEHYYGRAAVIFGKFFKDEIMAQFCAEGCRTYVFGELPCKAPDVRVVIIGRQHTANGGSVLELGWIAAASPRSGEHNGMRAVRQLMHRCRQEGISRLLVIPPPRPEPA